jgi:CheY-like chemotaxis protein
MVIMQSNLESMNLMDRSQGSLFRGGTGSAGCEGNSSESATASARRIRTGVGMRALVVDDDATTRRLHSRLLSIFHIRNAAADDGLEAVAMAMEAADAGDPFDLIIMDLNMPVVDGWGAAATLRAHGFAGTMIAVSGCADSDVEQRCAASGFDAYLPKPATVQALMATIDRSTGTRSTRSNKEPRAIAV